MVLVTGAIESLLPKLDQLLNEKYGLNKAEREKIRSLSRELEDAHACLLVISEVKMDELDEFWACYLREASYDMEDIIDTFFVCADAPEPAEPHTVRRLLEKVSSLFKKSKASSLVENFNDRLNEMQEMQARRERYRISDITNSYVAATAALPIDPRIGSLYTRATELVGIEAPRDDLINKLMLGGGNDDASNKTMKIVSIVGSGGLGKTTLAKAVYDKVKPLFECCAFVSVGQNPDVMKLFRDILYQLDRKFEDLYRQMLDERQLIHKLMELVKEKRYVIIIDDIWSTKVWNILKLSLPENHSGSIIITTTRIMSVANESCGGGTKGEVYNMDPLSDPDSQKLFFTRMFGPDGHCPAFLEKVSKGILKRCGGLPLAIISVSALLSSKPCTVEEWTKVYVMMYQNDQEISDMNYILSLSFHDLPSHLRTCMLYLSIFPEDYVIGREQLVWKWIAEGFIPKTHGYTLQQLGNIYFNELINRSMIQAVDIQYDGTVQACRVHDMMLELIVSISTKLNFVTIQDHKERKFRHDKIRRLSHQSYNVKESAQKWSDSLVHIRSLNLFGSVKKVPHLGNFKALRVLDFGSCRSIDDNHIKVIAWLFQLRYLGLYRTNVTEIPEEIGNLQYLQTIDLRGCGISKLPATFSHLKHLQRLLVQNGVTLPDDIGNMRALELLLSVAMASHSIRFVEELSKLIQIKTLGITFGKPSDMENEVRTYTDSLVSSLSKLVNLETLMIHAGDGSPLDSMMHICSTFESLQKLVIGPISELPGWILSLRNLLYLEIQVDTTKKEDINLLGGIPTLIYLELNLKHAPKEMLIVGKKGFECLQEFHLLCLNDGMRLVFEDGAMPRLRTLHLCLVAREAAISKNGGVYSSIVLLSRLENLHAEVNCFDCTNEEVEAMEASIVRAAAEHPNQLTFEMQRKFQERMRIDDDKNDVLQKPLIIRRNRRLCRVQTAFRWREARRKWNTTLRKRHFTANNLKDAT